MKTFKEFINEARDGSVTVAVNGKYVDPKIIFKYISEEEKDLYQGPNAIKAFAKDTLREMKGDFDTFLSIVFEDQILDVLGLSDNRAVLYFPKLKLLLEIENK